MSSDQFDLVVIGAGPGGYTGAIRAAQLGLTTAIIEKDSTLGGTCLNVGCIPSKALLESSEHYEAAQEQLKDHGVEVSHVKLNLDTLMARKNRIVGELVGGVDYLMKKNNITVFKGRGEVKSTSEVAVHAADGIRTLKTKNILLATGSKANQLPFLPYDEKQIVSSTGALSLTQVPKKLVVIGAGVIGLELGSVWNRLGSDVTIIEFTDKICGAMDAKSCKKLQQILKKQGLNFVMQAKVTSADIKPGKVTLSYESLKDGSSQNLEADVVLVATGRHPYSEGLGLENIGLEKDQRGCVTIDDHFRTKHPNIYAVGDLVRGPMLAHKAEEEGVAVAEIISGQFGHVNYETVPGVVYTWPEFASVGATEEDLKNRKIDFKVGQFPFTANGRAKALGCTDGHVKILADKNTDRVLGVHILGPRASDLIAEAVVAMEFGGSAEDIARSFHGHPTLSEVVREAALDVDKRSRQM
ncbi:MAG: dihydrolipoyl dehydrogenase [Bdellovibrionales bacterium]|nr:dihydrolipoyl dehydrogenase [Bdellovibrionales bacterium]